MKFQSSPSHIRKLNSQNWNKLLVWLNISVWKYEALWWVYWTLNGTIFMSRPLNSHSFTVCHTVLLPFSRSHGRFFISHDFTNFERIFSQAQSFLKKQTQAACSNVAEEPIFNMILKWHKQSQFSIFELNTFVHYVSEETY